MPGGERGRLCRESVLGPCNFCSRHFGEEDVEVVADWLEAPPEDGLGHDCGEPWVLISIFSSSKCYKPKTIGWQNIYLSFCTCEALFPYRF